MTVHDLSQPVEASSVQSAGSMLTRVRFAVLWLVVGCTLAGTMVVFFYEPGVLEEGVAGVMEGDPVTMGWAYVSAAMLGLPLALASATLFLTLRSTAIASLVLGVPLGAFGLFASVSEATAGSLHPHVALALVATAIAWVIVGLSVGELRRLAHGRPAQSP